MTGGCRFGVVALGQSFAVYESDRRAQGFDAILVRTWSPLIEVNTHVHAFAAKALVVQGEMWLTVGTETRHLQSGSTFELDSQVPHAERYGSEGATLWSPRRIDG